VSPATGRLVLAADGGQSAIRVQHSQAGAAVELDGVSRLEGDTVEAVAAAVIRGWAEAGSPPVERAVLGLTTAPTDAPSQDRLCEAVASGTGAPEVWLASDAITAHAGALSLGWGVSVTAGTGVVGLAVPDEGTPRMISGHGYLLGDEGGGFWIGREGLRAVLRAIDGRDRPTALTELAARRFGGLDDLGERIHTTTRPVNRIAQFAPDVLAVADEGDPVAVAIADGAAVELATLVRAGIASAPGSDERVPVALGGRLLATGSPLRRRLDAALAQGVPSAVARSADGSALDGALLLGAAEEPGRYGSLVYRWGAPA
jgi:glucosamine kinase